MARFFLLQLVLLFVLSGACFSQQTPIFRNFDVKDGMVHSYITAVTQDSKGFIWVGTSEGLHRFDGSTFKYFEPPTSSASFSSSSITSIYAHSLKNKVFIGYQGGNLSVYDLSTGLFSNYKLGEDENQSRRINSITYIDQSKVLIGVSGPSTLYTFNIDDSSIQEHKIKVNGHDDLIARTIRSIMIAKDQRVWISTDKGLLKSNKEINRFELIDTNGLNGVDLNNLNALSCIDSNSFLLTTSKSILIYNQITQEFKDITPIQYKDIEINTHIQDGYGNIWVATSSLGLLKFNLNENTFSQYKYSALQKNDIQSNNVLALYASSQEPIIWVGTDKGLSYFALKANPFKHFVPLKNNNEAIDDSFGLLQASNGDFWIIGRDSLYYSQGLERKFTSIKKTTPHFGALADRRVFNVVEDSNKNLWFATSDGLILYDYTVKRIFVFKIAGATPLIIKTHNYFRGISPYNNTLWLSTGAGFCSFDIVSRTFNTYPPPPDFNTERQYRHTYEILYDPDGYVWLEGRTSGAYRFNLKTQDYSHYTNNPADSTTIGSNGILSFCRDSKGDIWISSFFNGISRFNKKTNNFTRFSYADGLPSKTVYGIIEDKNGNLWMSTNKGVSKYNPSTGKFYNFNYFDGLNIYEFNSSSFTHSKNGDMFFGGIGGIVRFNPIEISEVFDPPTVYITDFYIQNKEVAVISKILNNQSILFRDQIELAYQKTTISFDITLLNYLYPHRSGFAWKLKDYENDWRIARPAENSISYTNLPPGTYDLWVKTTANFTNWSQEKKLIRIIITPPWWMNAWFKAVVILLIAIGILSFYSIRIHFLKKQKKHLNSLVQEKTEELKSLNESLEENNSEISAQNEELERHRYYLEDQVNERTTQLKLALLRAEESDRLKSAILSNMSHEVRTPLNAIVSYARFIEDESFQCTERKEFASIILQNSNTLLTLIDNIIELSRFQSENQTLVNETFYLNDLLRETLDECSKQRSLVVNCISEYTENDKFQLRTDRLKIRNTIKNLLSNAFKYTEKGHVRLGYKILTKESLSYEFNQNIDSESNRFVLFYVEDTGVGIAAEKCEVIFDLFTKGDEQSHKIYEGLGLGLTVCKMSVEMLGGSMWLKSFPSKGSVFYFFLPIN